MSGRMYGDEIWRVEAWREATENGVVNVEN
ncbi:hypothetical protein Tco_0618968, partial [Tanacetum coccineum]